MVLTAAPDGIGMRAYNHIFRKSGRSIFAPRGWTAGQISDPRRLEPRAAPPARLRLIHSDP